MKHSEKIGGDTHALRNVYAPFFQLDRLVWCVMRYCLHNFGEAADFLCPYLRYFFFAQEMRPKVMAEDSTLTYFTAATKISELWKDVRQRKRRHRIVVYIDFHADIWRFRRLAEEIFSFKSEKHCGSRVVVTDRYSRNGARAEWKLGTEGCGKVGVLLRCSKRRGERKREEPRNQRR